MVTHAAGPYTEAYYIGIKIEEAEQEPAGARGQAGLAREEVAQPEIQAGPEGRGGRTTDRTLARRMDAVARVEAWERHAEAVWKKIAHLETEYIKAQGRP